MSSAIGLRVPSPVVELADERLAAGGVRVLLKRDDLIHPELPGNKWRKLKYNLVAAREQGHDTLLTFGGAYSNHLRATAAAGHYGSFRTIGVVRGEQHLPLNPSLSYAEARGMQLSYLDRTTYRSKASAEVIETLHQEFGDFYLLPEGGSNREAVIGCAELPAELEDHFDVLFCAVGTGGTLAGIAAGLSPGQRAIGIPVIKGGEYLEQEITNLQTLAFGSRRGNWTLNHAHHFGGYAKRTPTLDHFITDFETRHHLRLDWVYVAKMMHALYTQAAQGAFAPGTTIVAVITGSDELPTSENEPNAPSPKA
ncbi:1-aminocyclopropane-1-carboxylate deaminase/D-cysteine desulfhydrase [Kribbella qitaiheensis]|uniref:1-aminocyclopropane-1-carboxylate deaminase/D-cysteine desulfhydrase n=1 Tax=Kribbella qitaiheensis TaxID=1544730 RepID=A0A7G6X6K7_9ACTN|nr:pyridoxal-phosphate dependent enzyme [Kribbella qitaiheensis]QNE21872.1 1-aminocyclopropane-1-carboxylate deaminase/D-cysteine desulfhydrase [Kribbella qitaiheensis]